MEVSEAKIKILAQAIYELRLLLADHLSADDTNNSASISAHLVYAIHNEALSIIEDRPEDFDVDKALDKIRKVDEIFGENYSESFNNLIAKART